jgi:signal transduction histidine kinase
VGLILHDATKRLLCLRARARRLCNRLPSGSSDRVEAEELCKIASEASELARSAVDAARLTSTMLHGPGTTVEAAVDRSIANVIRIRGSSPIEVKVPCSLSTTRVPGVVVALLENLIDNGVLASPHGSAVEVSVSKTRNEISFSVRNRGTVLRGNSTGRHRVDGDCEKETPRQGVALLFGRELASYVGGRIAFSNPCGGGTTATLVVPAVEGAGEVGQSSNLSVPCHHDLRGGGAERGGEGRDRRLSRRS